MFKRLRIRTKILIAFIVVAVVAVGVIGFFAFTLGSNILEEESFNKLTAVREMKANQIENYFRLIENQVITLSKDRMIIDAIHGFDDGLQVIEDELDLSDEQMAAIDSDLARYYEEEFLPRLALNAEEEIPTEDFWPADERARIMQYLYIANNPFEVGNKQLLDNPLDGSSYSQNHALFHPIIRDYLDRFGYYDIFLVDVETEGHIAYSVFKEVDYGTSLLTGPYAHTNLAAAYRAAREATDEDYVALVDYDPYYPSYGSPAAFIASPIFDEEEKIGVLIFQMPIDRINAIMTNDLKWSDVGLGESGETYLVGQDFTLRNQSRFLIEDSENYFHLIEDIGTSPSIIDRIRNLNTTIGLQEVRTAGTEAALGGETGTAGFPDYRGVPVLSAYRPLDLAGLRWAIMSEIDQAEAFASIRTLGLRLGIGSIGLIVFIIIAASIFSRTITKPIEDLQSQAGQISAGDLDTTISVDTKDEISDLADALETMRLSNKDLIDDLANINQNLENLVAERTAELEASERRSNSIIELAQDAIIVIDENENVHVWNAAAERIFGYSRPEMMGNTINLIVPEVHSPSHREALIQAIHSKSLKQPKAIYELSGKHKKGTEFPIELALSHWEQEGRSFFSASIRDITERKRAEEALRQSEERLTFALEGSNDGLWDWNPQTDALYFSPRWQTMLGFEPGELKPVIRTWEKLVHPEDLDQVNAIMAEHLAGKSPSYEAEYRLQSKGGAWVWILARGKIASYDEDGKPTRFVGTHTDITERKRAEQAIHEREERIRSIVEIAPDAIISIDGEQNITMFNTQAEEIFGYSAAEVMGQPLTMLIPEKSRSIHPAEVHKFLNESTNARFMDERRELAGRRKDGTIFPAEAGISKLKLDEKVLFTAFFRDITNRVKMEQAIRVSESRFRSLFEDSPISLWEEDFSAAKQYVDELRDSGVDDLRRHFDQNPDSVTKIASLVTIGRVNQATLDLYEAASEEDLYGNLNQVLTERSISYFSAQVITLAGGATSYQSETVNRKLNGELFDCIVDVSIAPGYEDSWAKVFVSITDISHLKELERQLAIANERMSTELNFARDIQLDMLPLIFPAFPNRTEVTVHAALDSAREVGGDFYDFYFLDDDHLCFVIGDVAGKGAPGALMMAVSKTLIKSRAADDDEPASILTHVNDELSQDNKSSMFVTVFLGIINVKTGTFVYTNAGHNPPFIRRRDGSLQKVDAFHGPVIGAMPGLPYQQDRDVLHPGDVILLYTDGVTEAFNEEEQLFSEERLEALLRSKSLDSAEGVVTGIIEKVNRFAGEAEQSDDITVLAVQYLGLSETMASQELNLTIKNRYEDMGIVEEQFSEFAEENALPDTVRQSISVVLDEMLNNIISYAYHGKKEKEIEVGFELSGNRLVVTIKDAGVPFNPFARETPDISEPIEGREIGGLGIHMVRGLMDEYSYQRQINKNVVTLVKLIGE